MFDVVAVLALLSATPAPGPIDAFRVNQASIKVDLRYRYTKGLADPALVGRLWSVRDPGYDAEPDYGDYARGDFQGFSKGEVGGRWSCDGAVEYYDFAPPDWLVQKLAGQKVKTAVNLPTEALYGESTFAGHHYLHQSGTPYIHIWDHENPVNLHFGTGPFLWWGVYPFPHVLKHDAPGARPRHGTSERNGHPVEVEIYEHEPAKAPGAKWRFEISYDPTVGYLPRYARCIYIYGDADKASVNEMYLIDVRRCSAGGFVPTEWYDTMYFVPDFSKRHPRFDDNTPLKPSGRIRLGYFKVTEFKDRSTPVALERLKGVTGIKAYGRVTRFSQPRRSLTMTELSALAGSSTTRPPGPGLPDLGGRSPDRSAIPTLDPAELSEFSEKPRHESLDRLGVAVVILVMLCAAFLLRRRFKGRAPSLLLLCCWAAGCSQNSPPPVARAGLSVSFARNHIFYSLKSHDVSQKLIVRNEGNRSIELRGADGGCSCRKIDSSKFPRALKPAESVELDAVFSTGDHSVAQGFAITFATDRGPMVAIAKLLALPNHQMSPDSFFTELREGQAEDWEFELVHRAVFPSIGPKPIVKLDVPSQFSVAKVGSHAEAVNQAPELTFEDTTYRITLHDTRLGMHKEPLTLRTADGEVILEVPVAWQRVPFLSTTPDRITLGTQPIRVFLRCPDELVEFTRVTGKPAGVKAVVSSVRELIVTLDEGADEVIDGQIEVGTTATNRPTLRIPVVRYSPQRRTAAVTR